MADKKRNKFEVYCDILGVLRTSGRINKTKLFTKSNINCTILEEYTKALEENNLIRTYRNGKRDLYGITEDGIKAHRDALSLLERFGMRPKISSKNPPFYRTT